MISQTSLENLLVDNNIKIKFNKGSTQANVWGHILTVQNSWLGISIMFHVAIFHYQISTSLQISQIWTKALKSAQITPHTPLWIF